jgi:hypothetical protein
MEGTGEEEDMSLRQIFLPWLKVALWGAYLNIT